MTGILTLEDEIARAITHALTHKLLGLPAAPEAGKPASINPDAYRQYLEGQHAFAPRTQEGVAKAVLLFTNVTALQPDFADGFAALGRALINHAEYHPEQKELMPEAEAALARALALDPDNVNALSAHLDLALHRLDWIAAGSDAVRLKAINPNGYAVSHEMFRYYQLLGFPDRALAAVQQTVKLNPLSFVDRYNVTAALIHIGKYADAIGAAHAALSLEPEQTELLAMLCTADAGAKRFADAAAVLGQLAKGRDETSRANCAFDIAFRAGKFADAHKIVDGFAAQYPKGDLAAPDIGELYAAAGDFDKATAWLSRGSDAKEFALFTLPFSADVPPAYLKTPGWKAIAARPMFRDWQTAHDKLATEFAAR
jgi:tetratricopeptide (TPR) repeat protein